MEAVVTHGIEDAALEERPRPVPDDDEAVVAVDRVQLSVTDCWQYQGKLSMEPSLQRRIDDGGALAFGHEFCGRIDAIGDDVDRFSAGDRVYAPGKVACGTCPYCRQDWSFLCENKETLGIGEYPGALAEYVAVPAETLSVLPDGVSDAEGAAMQPLADALLTVHDADVQTGDVVAVIGAGVMGSQCGQLVQHFGADRVFAVDIDAEKIELAERRGMIGVDASEVDPEAAIAAATDGIGPDVVFEAVGGDQSSMTAGDDPLAQAYRMVRPGGRIIQVGILTGEISYTPMDPRVKAVDVINPISAKGVKETGPNTDTGEMAATMVADGRVSIDDYVTHEVAGLESFEEAIEITTNKGAYGALGPAQIVVQD
jgi:threonine dehydrogenase-like Zn-dependent dehydrogenase